MPSARGAASRHNSRACMTLDLPPPVTSSAPHRLHPPSCLVEPGGEHRCLSYTSSDSTLAYATSPRRLQHAHRCEARSRSRSSSYTVAPFQHARSDGGSLRARQGTRWVYGRPPALGQRAGRHLCLVSPLAFPLRAPLLGLHRAIASRPCRCASWASLTPSALIPTETRMKARSSRRLSLSSGAHCFWLAAATH